MRPARPHRYQGAGSFPFPSGSDPAWAAPGGLPVSSFGHRSGVRCPQRPPECPRAERANAGLGVGSGCGCGHGRHSADATPAPLPNVRDTGNQELLRRSACRDTGERSRYDRLVFTAGGGRERWCEGRRRWGERALCHPVPQPPVPAVPRAGGGPAQGPFRGAQETGCDSCPNPRIGKKKPFLSAETHASNFNFPDD